MIFHILNWNKLQKIFCNHGYLFKTRHYELVANKNFISEIVLSRCLEYDKE